MLTGAYGVSTADALGYGIILQAVEMATAVVMGMPALLNEGLSWREVRLRAMNSTPGAAEAAARRRAGADARAGQQHRRVARPSGGPAGSRAMAEAYVYILRCADGSLYTGWTVDLDRRLAAHAAGTASRYTRSAPAGDARRRPGRWPTGRPRAARRRGSRR